MSMDADAPAYPSSIFGAKKNLTWPISSMGYSTTTGTSGLMLMMTLSERLVAFVKKFRYRKAKFNSTGSSISIITRSFSFSALAFARVNMLPVPRLPLTLNRIPSLLQLMVQVSPRTCRSRTMRSNSFAGILTVHLYGVSGMPSWSFSMSISLSSKSAIVSLVWPSKTMARLSPSSSAFSVSLSSLFIILKILARLTVLMPSALGRSHR
mmetsp:Transcript_10524/g.29013  ORF Transcript_10524/g.29013 Transcript_10524/m.29013 type:complete len:209 (+) Transcript_10524:180-806(+)